MEMQQSASAALALTSGRDVEYAAALALGFADDRARSEALAGDLNKRFPEDTFAQFTYVPVLRALATLQDRPTESLKRLQTTLRYELAPNRLNFNFYLGGLHPAYVRSQAFAAAHRYAEAIAEFQKILDHRGIVGADPIGALANLQLGRLYSLSGDNAKAKMAYKDLLTIWKDADRDIILVKQARTEYRIAEGVASPIKKAGWN